MKTLFRLATLVVAIVCLGAPASAQSCDCDECMAAVSSGCDACGSEFFDDGSCDCPSFEDACDSDGCDSMGGRKATRPRLSLSVSALFLDRDAPSGGIPLVSRNAGNQLLGSDDLEPDTGSGIRVGVGMQRGPYENFEFVYMNSDWDMTQSILGNGDLNAVLGTVDYTLADQIDVAYDSELQSFELNRWLDSGANFAWMLGLRYVSFDEEFRMSATDAAFTSRYDIDTQNDLYGAQIGGRIEENLISGNLQGHITGKAGVYANESRLGSVLRDVNNTVESRNTSLSGTDAAFLGDIDAGVVAHLNRAFKIRAGYQMLWLSEISLAPEHFQGTVVSADPVLNSSGNLFMHGAYVGVDLSW